MKEPEIVVLSGETRIDEWGNFHFKDKAGREHKIGERNKKRDELVELIVASPGLGVTVTYDTVRGKEGKSYDYISGIQPLAEGVKVDETKITEQQIKPAPQPAPATKPDSKNRAFALSYAKDIGCAKIQMGGSITPTEILNIAIVFTSYLDVGYSQEAIKIYAQTQKELKKEE